MEKIIGEGDNLKSFHRQILKKTQQDNEKVLFCIREDCKTPGLNDALIALNDRLVYVSPKDQYHLFMFNSIEFIDIHAIDMVLKTKKDFKRLGRRAPLFLIIIHNGEREILEFDPEYEPQVLIFAEWLRKLVREKRKGDK